MALNFNVSPYYDDFDPNKNYHKILFKPGQAVQARELTQSQSILQNQVSNFASAIFAQNTPISGGKVTINTKCDYIKLQASYLNNSIDVALFENQIIQNQAGDVLAQVIAVAAATDPDPAKGDPATLMVTYLTGTKFGNSDVIYLVSNSNIAAQIFAIGATGQGSVASVSQGVFYVVNGNYFSEVTQSTYQVGNFVNVLPQTVILDKYDGTPTLRLGLNIVETIYDYVDDVSLLDPASGSPNYQGPGADRYVINLNLETRTLALGSDDGFIELARVQSGVIIKMLQRTEYSSLDDYFALRTFETNGDFIVDNFNLTAISNTATPNFEGGYSQYDLKIGKGVAYVHGYRLENQGDLILTNDRAQADITQVNHNNYIDYGQYFYVDTIKGVFDPTVAQKVDLHITTVSGITSTNVTTYNSTLVGSGYIRGLVYDHNISDDDTSTYVYKSYVYNIVSNTLSANAVTGSAFTITFPSTAQFSPTSNAYYNATITIVKGDSAGDKRRIVSYNPSTKVATVDTAFTTSPTSASVFALQFSTKDIDSIVTPDGSYALTSSSNINTESKVSGIATNATIYKNTNAPQLIYNIGYPYVSSISSASYYSTQTFRNKSFSGTALTITLANPTVASFEGGPGTLSTDAIKQNFTATVVASNATANTGVVGTLIDLANTQNFSVAVSGTYNHILTITDVTVGGKFTLGTAVQLSIVAKVSVDDATNEQHILKTKTLVSGNTSANTAVSSSTVVNTNTYIDLSVGQVYIKKAGLVTVGSPQSLYVTDLKNIVKIVDSLNPAVAVTNAMLTNPINDITYNYTLDNGQRDSIYDHASITLKPGVNQPIGNILVIFNYYSHVTSDGYYSYESYRNSGETYGNIPSYKSTSGLSYNLRDCIDFRPSRVNGTSTYTYEYSGDPTSDDSGTYLPQDLSNFQSNYSYYFGRKDILVLSKDKNFQIVQGNPALNPIYPNQPDGSLLIANLSHDPYTIYIPNEAPKGVLPNLSISKVKHRRWRMQDISELEERFETNASTLSSLEQAIADEKILDSNGIDRPKNAVIVDDFTSYSVVDTSNPDFSASIDTLNKVLWPAFAVTNYALQANTTINSMGQLSANTLLSLGYTLHNIGTASTYITLPYTSSPVVTQQLASRTLNLNPFSVQVFQGVCSLYPPMDNWVDNNVAPDLLLANIDNLVQSTTINATNVTCFQAIPGTPYATANTSSLVSSYTLNNSYIHNNSIQSYIRAQQVIVRAKNMKVNSPIHCYFDGTKVDTYMANPDIIELSNASGQFIEDDVIGLKSSLDNTFYPIAVVANIYQYPSSNNVRLYVTSNFHSDYNFFTQGESISNVISNAKFDANGNYVSNTAFGYITDSKVITTKNNGYIMGVGGSFTDANSNTITGIYSVTQAGYGNFATSYGIWHNQNRATVQIFDVTFPLTVATTGTYYFASMGDDEIGIYLNGSLITGGSGSGTLYSYSATLTAGVQYKLRVLNTQSDTDCFVAAAISTKSWTGGINATTTGSIVWSTRTPHTSTLPAAISGVAQVFSMPGGGVYYTGVTKVALHPASSNTSNSMYVGSQINITTNYISYANTNATFSQSLVSSSNNVGTSTPYYFSANVTTYDPNTRIATLDAPVSISIGQNLTYNNIDSTYNLIGTANNYIVSQISGNVSSLSTNETGTFCGIFNVPPATFTNQSKTFRIDNRSISNDASTATTYSEATFYGSSLGNINATSGQFSPSVVSASQVILATAQAPNVVVNPSTLSNLLDPIAQTFSIDSTTYPRGVFLYSMKFFFQSKATVTQSPVNLSIVGTSNGTPNGITLDNSIVTLTPDRINVSNTPYIGTASTATEFVFKAPVFIQPGVKYALILQSQSTEYNIWLASQNDTALQSSVGANTAITKISTVPYTGSLFETQNSINWIGDATKSLMFVVNRCIFDITKHPKIPFVVPLGAPTHKFIQQNIASYYGTSLVNFPNNMSNNDVEIDALNVTTTDYIPAKTSIVYSYKAMLKNTKLMSAEKLISPGRSASPNLQNENLNDNLGPRLLQANNANSFVLYATMSSTDSTISPIIADDGLTMYDVRWGINNLPLTNGLITLVDGGTGYNVQTTQANVSSPDFGSNKATANVSIVNGVVTGVSIINPGAGYLNPASISIFDANTSPGSGASVVVASEFSPKGGNAIAKYISKIVPLSISNESGDFRFYFTAYRPIGTNLYVFYRVLNTNDSQRFENGSWQLMTYINNSNQYSQSITDLINFQLAPGINGVANNFVKYTSTTSGSIYNTFNQFAFKVIMTTDDNTKVPQLTNLSIVATPAGV